MEPTDPKKPEDPRKFMESNQLIKLKEPKEFVQPNEPKEL
jgi:hypothetical protein